MSWIGFTPEELNKGDPSESWWASTGPDGPIEEVVVTAPRVRGSQSPTPNPNPPGASRLPPPYVVDEPPVGEITVTAKPWQSGPQLPKWPTTYGGVIGGTDFRNGQRGYGSHNGVDFRNRINDPAFSVVDGTIEDFFYDDKHGGGNTIYVRDAQGNLFGYAHTGAIDGLTKGQAIKAGDQIGISDGTGRIEAPHLHFTYRPGTPDKPATFQTPVADPRSLFDTIGGTHGTQRVILRDKFIRC